MEAHAIPVIPRHCSYLGFTSFSLPPALVRKRIVIQSAQHSSTTPIVFLVKGLPMENPETLSLKLLGIFEVSASGQLAIVLATVLAAALIVRVYRR